MGLNTIRIKPIKIKYKYEPDFFFTVLLGLIWANSTLVKYLKAILIRIPYVADIREYVVSFIFLVAIVLSLSYIAKRIKPNLILIYFAVVTIYLLNYFLFPNNQAALEDNLVPFLFKSLPLVFIGVSIDLKRHYQVLYYLSIISIYCRFIHLLLDPVNMIYGDMQSSYQLLPHVCMVIAGTLEKADIKNTIASVLGVVTIFSYGSRGPILCICALVILYMMVYKKVHMHIWLYIFFVISIVCTTFFYEDILNLLSIFIQRIGMSTRVIDMILYGEIFNSTGRNAIQNTLFEALKLNWLGYGIAGDRAIAGTYAHNLLLELWVSYGIILGSIVFLFPITIAVKVLIQIRNTTVLEDNIVLVLIASSFVKLFLSGTYLNESFLFLLIGIVLMEHRKNSTRKYVLHKF